MGPLPKPPQCSAAALLSKMATPVPGVLSPGWMRATATAFRVAGHDGQVAGREGRARERVGAEPELRAGCVRGPRPRGDRCGAVEADVDGLPVAGDGNLVWLPLPTKTEVRPSARRWIDFSDGVASRANPRGYAPRKASSTTYRR